MPEYIVSFSLRQLKRVLRLLGLRRRGRYNHEGILMAIQVKSLKSDSYLFKGLSIYK